MSRRLSLIFIHIARYSFTRRRRRKARGCYLSNIGTYSKSCHKLNRGTAKCASRGETRFQPKRRSERTNERASYEIKKRKRRSRGRNRKSSRK